MPLALTPERAVLTDHITIEEAEPLLEWLRDAESSGTIDVAGCCSMHMAVLQLLAVATPVIEGASTADWRALLLRPHSFQPEN
ncbi:MAG: hypothetical protein ACPGNV_02760 [Mangrovicoccus sp.]